MNDFFNLIYSGFSKYVNLLQSINVWGFSMWDVVLVSIFLTFIIGVIGWGLSRR